jgi:hypothetical protein
VRTPKIRKTPAQRSRACRSSLAAALTMLPQREVCSLLPPRAEGYASCVGPVLDFCCF